MQPSDPPETLLRDIDYRDPDEARDALRERTSRVTRISARGSGFRLRYRSLETAGLHVSRTWESHAEFEINGQIVPVVFFPVSGGTVLTTRGGETRMTPETLGCFTVAEPARFAPAKGYSEIVLRLDPGTLRSALDLLDVDADLTRALAAAALRRDLPGLGRLRALAIDFFEGCPAEPEPFRTRYALLQQEAIALRAAAVLATALGGNTWPRPVGSHPAVARATEYIRGRLQDDVGFHEIAAAAGVSLRLLQALFRRDLGCTPGEFIRQERLMHARALLESGKVETVTQAALDSGFTHLGKFSAIYSQRFGEQPSKTLRRRP